MSLDQPAAMEGNRMSEATPEVTTPEPEQPQGEPAAKPDEQLGEGGTKALAAERTARKEAEKRIADLQQQVSEAQTAQQSQLDAIAKALGLKDDTPDAGQIAQQLEESRREAATNAAALTRYQVVVEKAVPAHLVDFVTGSTREEVEASVDKVLAAFGSATPRSPQPDPSQGQQGAPTSLDAQIAAAESAGNTREVIRLKARKGLSNA